MEVTTGVQETTANVVVVDSYNKVTIYSPLRKSVGGTTRAGMRSRPSANNKRLEIFAQEVKEAERSTLIFRTQPHGVSNPVMNPETMKEQRLDGQPSQAVARVVT
jgi:hypothetical protein